MIICHVISSLNNGGAENVLLKTCKYSNKKINTHYVISLINIGDLRKEYMEACENVFFFNFKKNIFIFFEIYKLYSLIKKINPNVLIGWMYHSSFLISFIGRILKIKRIYWNIRHTELILFQSSFTTILIAKFMALISKRIPNKIIYCSIESKIFHTKYGFKNINTEIIHNGVSTFEFKYSNDFHINIRNKLNIPNHHLVIGMVANYRPQKNHEFFLNSLKLFKEHKVDFTVIMAGRNINLSNTKLTKIININNLENNIILLDQVNNISQILSTFDILVLTSNFGESFSNVLIEAM